MATVWRSNPGPNTTKNVTARAIKYSGGGGYTATGEGDGWHKPHEDTSDQWGKSKIHAPRRPGTSYSGRKIVPSRSPRKNRLAPRAMPQADIFTVETAGAADRSTPPAGAVQEFNMMASGGAATRTMGVGAGASSVYREATYSSSSFRRTRTQGMAAGMATSPIRPGSAARSVTASVTAGKIRARDPSGKIKAAATLLHTKGQGNTAALVAKATRIGTPRLIHEDEVPYTTIKKKVVREVEVPFVRNVKVPTKTKKIVPQKTMVQVKTKRLQPVQKTKVVKEEYTAMVPKTVTREKVVWVKKIVPETVTEMVPVKKFRDKQVAYTDYAEVDGTEMVEVTRDAVVEVDGFRIDQVKDRKLVEVEETEEYELRPTRKIDEWVHDARSVGRIKGARYLERKLGETYEAHEVESVSDDSQPSDTEITMKEILLRPQFTRIGFTLTNGCKVKRVVPGGAAQRAGIQVNDIIEYVGNDLSHETLDLPDFRKWVMATSGPLKMKLLRNGSFYTTTVMRD